MFDKKLSISWKEMFLRYKSDLLKFFYGFTRQQMFNLFLYYLIENVFMYFATELRYGQCENTLQIKSVDAN